MKKMPIILGMYLISLILVSMNRADEPTITELPSAGIQAEFEVKLASFIEMGNEFHQSIESTSRAAVVAKFLLLRMRFKEIEFLIAYVDPQLFNTELNGAPLPRIMEKVPDLTIIEPRGLQRMEEIVYTDNFERTELLQSFEKFQESIKQFATSFGSRKLLDAEVFESIRFGLIRLNTLNATGFDAPANSDKVPRECVEILRGMKSVINNYSSFASSPQMEDIDGLFNVGIHQFNTQSFESFDHLSFLINVINPLWKTTLEFQQELRIELPSQRFSFPQFVNYTSTNLYADDFLNAVTFSEFSDLNQLELQIELGKNLFFDPILSSNNKMACATCHHPQKAFTDGLKISTTRTNIPGQRNTPTLINSIYTTRYFHDVRTDRLSLQMDHVVYNPTEFATDYNEIIAKLNASEVYKTLFEEAYQDEPISKHAITNAMSAYVSSLRSFNSDFDRYVRGELGEIEDEVKRGYNLFQGKAACATCHFAPTFAGTVPPFFNETETEVLGIPASTEEPYQLDSDLGRYMNKLIMEQALFYQRSFKTPTLRNISLTGPYMHNGVFETLEEVVDFYDAGGGIGLGMDVNFQTLPSDSLNLTDQEKKDIISFMKSLTDTTGMTSKSNVFN